jgi:hypothetical protein
MTTTAHRTTAARATGSRARLPFRTAGDLAEALAADVLTAMQADAQALAERSGPSAGSWQALADSLGEACAIAEREQQLQRTPRRRSVR